MVCYTADNEDIPHSHEFYHSDKIHTYAAGWHTMSLVMCFMVLTHSSIKKLLVCPIFYKKNAFATISCSVCECVCVCVCVCVRPPPSHVFVRVHLIQNNIIDTSTYFTLLQ